MVAGALKQASQFCRGAPPRKRRGPAQALGGQHVQPEGLVFGHVQDVALVFLLLEELLLGELLRVFEHVQQEVVGVVLPVCPEEALQLKSQQARGEMTVGLS